MVLNILIIKIFWEEEKIYWLNFKFVMVILWYVKFIYVLNVVYLFIVGLKVWVNFLNWVKVGFILILFFG